MSKSQLGWLFHSQVFLESQLTIHVPQHQADIFTWKMTEDSPKSTPQVMGKSDLHLQGFTLKDLFALNPHGIPTKIYIYIYTYILVSFGELWIPCNHQLIHEDDPFRIGNSTRKATYAWMMVVHSDLIMPGTRIQSHCSDAVGAPSTQSFDEENSHSDFWPRNRHTLPRATLRPHGRQRPQNSGQAKGAHTYAFFRIEWGFLWLLPPYRRVIRIRVRGSETSSSCSACPGHWKHQSGRSHIVVSILSRIAKLFCIGSWCTHCWRSCQDLSVFSNLFSPPPASQSAAKTRAEQWQFQSSTFRCTF